MVVVQWCRRLGWVVSGFEAERGGFDSCCCCCSGGACVGTGATCIGGAMQGFSGGGKLAMLAMQSRLSWSLSDCRIVGTCQSDRRAFKIWSERAFCRRNSPFSVCNSFLAMRELTLYTQTVDARTLLEREQVSHGDLPSH